MHTNYWETLNLAPTRDKQLVRDAYFNAISGLHPERDAGLFQQLRQAYEQLISELTIPEFHTAARRQQAVLEPYIKTTDSVDTEAVTTAIHQPQNTATYYLEKLTDRLKFDSQQSAVFYLEKIIKEPDFNSSTLRMEFEQGLQYLLASVVPFPAQLAQRAITLFQWHNTPKTSQPAYLSAVTMLLTRHKARQRLHALRQTSERRRDPHRRIAGALLGRHRPWYFRRLALTQRNLKFARDWIAEFEQDYPGLLPVMLDPDVVQWWKKAAFNPRLTGRHLVNAASLSSVGTLIVMGFSGFLSGTHELNALVPTLLFVILLAVFCGLQYTIIRLFSQLAPARSALQKTCGKIRALCTDKLHTHLAVMPIFILSFALSILLDGSLAALFAAISYGLLLAVFGVSLFMIINFVALVLSFIYTSQPWVQHLVTSSKFKLHSFAVLDIAVSYFIINILLILAGCTLRVVLGIRKEFQVDQMFYGFLIVTLILIVHSIVFGMVVKF